jgi:polyisoprenoid-binding protein YceI
MKACIALTEVCRGLPVLALPADPIPNRPSKLNPLNSLDCPSAIVVGLLLLAGAVHLRAAESPLRGTVIYASTSPMADFSGTNTAVTGTAVWDKASGIVQAEVSIDLTKWSSGSALREKHTLAMFEVDRFPKASFSLTGMAAERAGTSVTLKGALDLHGVKRPLDILGKLNMETNRVDFSGDFTLRLTEWGMKRPSLLGAQVDDLVKVRIQAEALAK